MARRRAKCWCYHTASMDTGRTRRWWFLHSRGRRSLVAPGAGRSPHTWSFSLIKRKTDDIFHGQAASAPPFLSTALCCLVPASCTVRQLLPGVRCRLLHCPTTTGGLSGTPAWVILPPFWSRCSGDEVSVMGLSHWWLLRDRRCGRLGWFPVKTPRAILSLSYRCCCCCLLWVGLHSDPPTSSWYTVVINVGSRCFFVCSVFVELFLFEIYRHVSKRLILERPSAGKSKKRVVDFWGTRHLLARKTLN